MTWQDSPLLRVAPFVLGAVVSAVILLVFFLPDRDSGSRMQASGLTQGRILVDSPEVYTRERMVNDRFRQEAWLLARLDEIEETSIQGVVEGQQTSTRSARLSLAKSGETPPADDTVTADDAGKGPAPASGTQGGQPRLSQTEVFRSQQAFREEVRNAIIENQLDDRHDLGGNTLYRLKFDATVIPGSDTSAWAQIKVRFRRTPDQEETAELRELYERWMGDLREQVNAAAREETVKALKNKPAIYEAGWRRLSLGVGDWAPPWLEITDQACRKALLQKASQQEDAESDFRISDYTPERYVCLIKLLADYQECAARTCAKEIAIGNVLATLVDSFGNSLCQKAPVRIRHEDQNPLPRSQEFFDARAAGGDGTQCQRYVAFAPDPGETSILVEEYTPRIYAVPLELSDEERTTYHATELPLEIYAVPVELSPEEREAYRENGGQVRVLAIPASITADERDRYHSAEQLGGPDGVVSDEQILATWAGYLQCDEQVRISVQGRELRICAAERMQLGTPADGVGGGDEPEPIDAVIESDSDGQPIVVANADVPDEEILAAWSGFLGCDEQVRIRVAQREFRICASSLPELREFAVEEGTSGGDQGPPAFDLKIRLGYDGQPLIDEELYSGDQRILEGWAASLYCERPDLVRVAGRVLKICAPWLPGLQRRAGSKDGDGKDEPTVIDGVLETGAGGQPVVVVRVGFQEFRRKLQKSADRKFLFAYAVTPRESSQHLASSSRLAVAEQLGAIASGGLGAVGIGAGAGRSSSVSEYARILERRPVVVGIATHASTQEQSAEFGWLIGPKLVIGADGLPAYRHLPSQNSLAAIVSAPSWWRRADIEIETGWLDESGELKGEPTTVEYPIALPGDQEEITSALLLGGKRPAPLLDSVEPQRLQVGEKVKLLIEGQNLWRSTVVTIGSQRSKQIFVLPNMKGIIAEFDAIEEQATRPAGLDSTTTLRVWTSEGMAKLAGGITIEQEGP